MEVCTQGHICPHTYAYAAFEAAIGIVAITDGHIIADISAQLRGNTYLCSYRR